MGPPARFPRVGPDEGPRVSISYGVSRASTLPAETDILCETCGYVLNGLPPDGRCPECGNPLVDSAATLRSPPAWEEDSNPFPSRLIRTTGAVLFRPTAFYRTLETRPAFDRSASFAYFHWAISSALFAAAAWTHFTWGAAGAGLVFMLPVNSVVAKVTLAVLTFVSLLALTRLAARLTTWEATYRGIRLPTPVVLRGMYFHAAHYLPVALIAAVTVIGYQVLLARGVLSPMSTMKYVYVLSAEVIAGAVYLFWTYWIGMRNMMYANA